DLRGEDDDLDASWRQRGLLRSLGSGNLRAEADCGDLASSEPARRVDSVLGDQIAPHSIGLLLGQGLGQIRIAIVIGEGRDDNLRSRQAGLLAPPGNLVKPGAPEWSQDRLTGFEEILGSKRTAGPARARLEQ